MEINAEIDKFLALSDELPDIEGAMKTDAPLDKLMRRSPRSATPCRRNWTRWRARSRRRSASMSATPS